MNMIAGTRNFGVGISPIEKEHFIGLTGYDDLNHDNYGNYEYINPRTNSKSKMVFIPSFYYRIGHLESPRYEKYGLNAIDVEPYNTFSDELTANKEGYSLHRAFIDGGIIQSGFFIDKYLASKDGNETCKSEFGENPISLAANASYNPSNGMTGCTGILADAVVLSKSRGTGMQCSSIFQYAALGLLILAHAQASTNNDHNAWYDPDGIINYPKGCNNNALADVDDTSVTYTASYGTKPNCGASANFNKTTHNGQGSGVADLNGSLYQVMVGLTSHGTSSTDYAQNSSGNAYVLKPSVKIATMTGSFGATNDFWGTRSNLLTNYDLITGLFPWGTITGWAYWGNGISQVFDGSTSLVNATSSIGYLRTVCGLPKDTNSTTATQANATNQMGKNGIYQYNVANLFPLFGGRWNNGSNAGVFARDFGISRSSGGSYVGFRVSAY